MPDECDLEGVFLDFLNNILHIKKKLCNDDGETCNTRKITFLKKKNTFEIANDGRMLKYKKLDLLDLLIDNGSFRLTHQCIRQWNLEAG